eukprot:scaffold46810_cov91-Cyclotella_meneghiniana.AAC.3
MQPFFLMIHYQTNHSLSPILLTISSNSSASNGNSSLLLSVKIDSTSLQHSLDSNSADYQSSS